MYINLANRVTCRIISAAQTIPLRHAVLRADQPIESAQYAEDKSTNAVHFGAFLQKNKSADELVGVLSIYQEPVAIIEDVAFSEDITKKLCWRLRGMAIKEIYHRHGFGTTLLNTCYAYTLEQTKIQSGIWCNARTKVVPYYAANGFEIAGKEFTLPNIGPHYLMINPTPVIRPGIFGEKQPSLLMPTP